MTRFLIFMSTLFLSATATAQEQSHVDAAQELIELVNADQVIDQLYDQMYPQLDAMADQLGLTDEQRPIFDKYLERMIEAMKEEMSWAKMEPFILRAYVDVYSEDELRGLIEFYASPLGQKFVAKMPELMQASSEMTMEMMQDFLPRMQEIQAQLVEELRQQADDKEQ